MLGYGAHNIEMTQQTSTDVSNTLDNLVSATIAKNERMEKLPTTICHIHCTKENEKLFCIVENLTGTTGKMQRKPNINPNGHCWTHGYCIGHGHNSKICTACMPGHKEEVTRGNFLGGSQANKPKVDK